MAEEELIAERKRKLQALRGLGIDPYPYSYQQTHHAQEILSRYASLKNEEHTKDRVSIAGRIMSLRRMGKAAFFDVKDWTGKIQVYLRQDKVGEKTFEIFKNLDIADWVGIKGDVFRTKLGELSVSGTEL